MSVLERRVGDADILYGSVTSADIADALNARQFEIDKRKVVLPDPIKRTGEFDVPVKIHRDVTAHVKVRIVPLGGAAKPRRRRPPRPRE